MRAERKKEHIWKLAIPQEHFCDHGKGLFMFIWSGHVLFHLNQGYVTLGPGEFFLNIYKYIMYSCCYVKHCDVDVLAVCSEECAHLPFLQLRVAP